MKINLETVQIFIILIKLEVMCLTGRIEKKMRRISKKIRTLFLKFIIRLSVFVINSVFSNSSDFASKKIKVSL